MMGDNSEEAATPVTNTNEGNDNPENPVSKRACGLAKGAVTRKMNVIRELQKQDSVDGVEETMAELDAVCTEFDNVNQQY